jgi:hypothetical protein
VSYNSVLDFHIVPAPSSYKLVLTVNPMTFWFILLQFYAWIGGSSFPAERDGMGIEN